MVTSEPTCSIVRELFPVTSFTLQLWRQQTQTREDLPIDWFLSTGGFRVRCPFLPAHSSIEMLASFGKRQSTDFERVSESTRWTMGRWQGQLLVSLADVSHD